MDAVNFDVIVPIVQALTVAVLSWVAKTVWNASINLAKLDERLNGHIKSDDTAFAQMREDVRDAAESARAALYRHEPR